MVLRLSHTLTSFSITLIYVLFRSFEKLWIGKPFSSCSSTPERFLVLSRRLEDSGAGSNLISKALQWECEAQVVSSGGQLEPGSKAVAEVLPLTQALTDRSFYSYLASCTSTLAESQMKSLKQLLDEKSLSSLDNEDQGDLSVREADQRARSVKAIIEERDDLKVIQPDYLLPAPKWSVRVKQEVQPKEILPQASAQPSELPSQLRLPAPRPPPSLAHQSSTDAHDPSIFPLFTRHHTKGNELVCHLKIEPWPLAQVMGMREFVVYEFVPRASIDVNSLVKNKQRSVAKAKPATAQDAKALRGFVDYMYGAGRAGPGQEEGAAMVARKEKMAIVKWGSLDFYLTVRTSDDPNYNLATGLWLFV